MVVEALAKVGFKEEYRWMMDQITNKTDFESLGFQRPDKPETDIRGGGMLGLLVLINLINNKTKFDAVRKHNTSDLPLALTSFEVTVEGLKHLRKGKLEQK